MAAKIALCLVLLGAAVGAELVSGGGCSAQSPGDADVLEAERMHTVLLQDGPSHVKAARLVGAGSEAPGWKGEPHPQNQPVHKAVPVVGAIVEADGDLKLPSTGSRAEVPLGHHEQSTRGQVEAPHAHNRKQRPDLDGIPDVAVDTADSLDVVRKVDGAVGAALADLEAQASELVAEALAQKAVLFQRAHEGWASLSVQLNASLAEFSAAFPVIDWETIHRIEDLLHVPPKMNNTLGRVENFTHILARPRELVGRACGLGKAALAPVLQELNETLETGLDEVASFKTNFDGAVRDLAQTASKQMPSAATTVARLELGATTFSDMIYEATLEIVSGVGEAIELSGALPSPA